MPPTVPSLARGTAARLYVVGDPIVHSLSPALHLAAYRVLGMPWSYAAARVPAGGLAGFVDDVIADSDEAPLRGLSVTMPLKREAAALTSAASSLVVETGIANTLTWQRLADGNAGVVVRADNTDVYGVVSAVSGRPWAESIAIIGSGATAISALYAARELACAHVHFSARNAEAAESLAVRARALGLDASVSGLDRVPPVDAVIDTLPGDAAGLGDIVPRQEGGWMLSVAYAGGESEAARGWKRRGGVTVDGRYMLLHQALRQVQLFVAGSVEIALPREAEVLSAMQAVLGVGGDTAVTV